MSSQCHRNVLPIFFNDKNYRLFGEIFDKYPMGVYHKCENSAKIKIFQIIQKEQTQ